MSECRLHVLDAPRVKAQEAAADWVAKWSDQGGKPSARIDAFLQELLQAYPIDAEAANTIWYETPAPGASTAPLLTLYFKLSSFDADALKTLCSIARKHKLHVFDEEGYVLYLANGQEVSKSTSDPFEALKIATRSPSGLRYDGVYVAKMEVGWSYYRFAANGKIFRLSCARQVSASAAFRDMVEGDPFVAHGKYVIDDEGVAGKVKQHNGVFYISARILGNTLSLKSVRKDGRFPYSAMYEFAGVL